MASFGSARRCRARGAPGRCACAVALVLVAGGEASAQSSPAGIAVGVAGNGAVGGRGFTQGATATSAPLPVAESVAALPGGGFLVTANCAVWSVRGGIVARVAGNGTCEFKGDGGPALQASLENPSTVTVALDGGLLIGDGHRVRRVGPDGLIATVAGNGTETSSGDHGPALLAGLEVRGRIAALPDNAFLVVDGDRVRRVDAAGTITTVAGTGQSGFSGDGGPATGARFSLSEDSGVVALDDGGFLIADTGNQRVRRVDPAGIVHTVAGDGRQGRGGDGGPAVRARLIDPTALVVDADGSWLVGMTHRIRRVAPDGTISTIAGSARDWWTLTGVGNAIFNGDGLPARHAALTPSAMARAADGSLLVALGDAARVLAITAPTTTTPGIAIVRTRVSSRRVGLDVVSTVGGTVHGSLSAHGAVAERSDASIAPGRTTLELRRPRAPGVYRADVTLTGPAGTAIATIGLLIGPLTRPVARAAIYRWATATQLSNGHLKGCVRFSSRRVDCENADDEESCLMMNAVTTGASGLVRLRTYPCPSHGQRTFRRHPRWWTIDGSYTPFNRPGVVPGPLLGPIY